MTAMSVLQYLIPYHIIPYHPIPFHAEHFLLCVYLPLFRHYREFFGKALNDHIDPDVTVAYGAASILD